MKKKTKCYIYTRVSTAIQVDGYSLDAQKDKLRKYAEFQDMEIVGEYSDEGHSGKNIKGRQEFMRMLNDIEDGKDGVDFVLVFKLSRFGRNAADVLSSLQLMQDYGVNLICVEDGIDSSKEAGKLLISCLYLSLRQWQRWSGKISECRQWLGVSRRREKVNGMVDLLHMDISWKMVNLSLQRMK